MALSDKGSGVDPATLSARIDGRAASVQYAGRTGRAVIPISSTLTPGRHVLTLQVSDYQEEKNSESVPGVLPNTRFYTARFTVTG